MLLRLIRLLIIDLDLLIIVLLEMLLWLIFEEEIGIFSFFLSLILFSLFLYLILSFFFLIELGILKVGLVFDFCFLVFIIVRFEVLEIFELLFEFELIRLFEVNFVNVFLKDFIIIFKYL